MTTLEAEIALMRHFNHSQKDIVFGLTPWSQLVRFETDMLVLTQSRLAYAVEIKVSKADLRADRKKEQIKALNGEKHRYYGGKLLVPSIENMFKRIRFFYYAVPEELEEAALKQIPDQCGLLVVSKYRGHLGVRSVRRPKTLHNYKWTDAERMNLLRLGTMRQYTLKNNILELQQWRPKNKKN